MAKFKITRLIHSYICRSAFDLLVDEQSSLMIKVLNHIEGNHVDLCESRLVLHLFLKYEAAENISNIQLSTKPSSGSNTKDP